MGKNFSFYEQTGILIPGATLVFGLLFFFPEFRALFFSDGVSIGGPGLFLLIFYAAGHLAAPLRRIMEIARWLGPGRPAHWGGPEKTPVLSPQPAHRPQQPIPQRLPAARQT